MRETQDHSYSVLVCHTWTADTAWMDVRWVCLAGKSRWGFHAQS